MSTEDEFYIEGKEDFPTEGEWTQATDDEQTVNYRNTVAWVLRQKDLGVPLPDIYTKLYKRIKEKPAALHPIHIVDLLQTCKKE